MALLSSKFIIRIYDLNKGITTYKAQHLLPRLQCEIRIYDLLLLVTTNIKGLRLRAIETVPTHKYFIRIYDLFLWLLPT